MKHFDFRFGLSKMFKQLFQTEVTNNDGNKQEKKEIGKKVTHDHNYSFEEYGNISAFHFCLALL